MSIGTDNWEVSNTIHTLSKYRQGEESCYETLVRILADYHYLKSMEYDLIIQDREDLRT